MTKFNQDNWNHRHDIWLWIVFVGVLILCALSMPSCKHKKQRYILKTHMSCDTVETFNINPMGWVYYNKPDGAKVYLYHPQIDTIQ